MREEFDCFVTDRTENHARMVLIPRDGSGIIQLTGVVRGPFSDFSKTLTADSPIKPGTDGAFGALVVEPCYWTPSLPFWYELRLRVTFEDGVSRDEVLPVGIKRFYCEGRNVLLEGKRVVLRGMATDALTNEDFKAARDYETALIVERAKGEECATASRFGVPLIVDLRAGDSALGAALEWHPAVMLALVNAGQVEFLRLRNVYSAICVGAASTEPQGLCDAYAIELRLGERPPAWAATCNKPVIVIRKGPEADIRTARAGCDKLQAELAPEFDLAGYFVWKSK